jgi:hypothetical protein
MLVVERNAWCNELGGGGGGGGDWSGESSLLDRTGNQLRAEIIKNRECELILTALYPQDVVVDSTFGSAARVFNQCITTTLPPALKIKILDSWRIKPPKKRNLSHCNSARICLRNLPKKCQ